MTDAESAEATIHLAPVAPMNMPATTTLLHLSLTPRFVNLARVRLHRSHCIQLQPYRLRRRWILRILHVRILRGPATANYYPDADSFDNDICVYCDPGTFIFEVDMAKQRRQRVEWL